jgi:hypothetical protein
MEEHLKKVYNKEEEFLDEFGDLASVVARTLNNEWQPNYAANNGVRKNQDYFFSRGELKDLVFDSASTYHDNSGFSSAQIILKSSHRLVNVRVRLINGELVGERIVDRPIKRR